MLKYDSAQNNIKLQQQNLYNNKFYPFTVALLLCLEKTTIHYNQVYSRSPNTGLTQYYY